MTAAANIGTPDLPFDTIIVPVYNGSPDYLEWVQLQTMKKGDQLAYFNLQPEKAMKAR